MKSQERENKKENLYMKSIEQLEQQLKKITLERELILKITGEIELDKLLDIFGNELHKDLGFYGFLFSTIDEPQNGLVVRKVIYHSEMKKIENVLVGNLIPFEQDSIALQCLEKNEKRVVDENTPGIGQYIKQRLFLLKSRYMAYIPIIKNDMKLGLIHLVNKKQAFTENDFNLIDSKISVFINQMYNAIIHSDLKERESQVNIISKKIKDIIDIANRMNNLTSLSSIYHLILNELIKLLNFDFGAVLIYSDHFLHYVSGAYSNKAHSIFKGMDKWLKSIKGYSIDPADGATAVAYVRNSHFYFDDIQSIIHLPMSKKDKDYLTNLKTPKSLLIMPIENSNGVIGILHLFSVFQNAHLNETDISILRSLCSFIGTAINNARLYTLVEEQKDLLKNRTIELQRAQDEISNIIEIARQINSTLDFDTIFKKVADYLKHTYGFEGFSFGLVTPDEKHYKIEIWIFPDFMNEINKKSGIFNPVYPLDERGGLAAECIIQKKTLYITDLNPSSVKNEINRKMIEYFNIKTLLNLPIIIENKAIGVFSLTCHSKPIYLDEKDIDAINRFVIQIAGAIKNSKLYTEIEQQKAFSNSLLDNSPYGIQVIDKTGKVIYVNPACLKISGYNKSQIEGVSWIGYESIIKTGLDEDFTRALQGELVQRENVNFESSLTGKKQILNLTISPIKNSLDEIENILVMYYDNTEKAVIEEHVKTLLQELQHKDRILTEDLFMAMKIQQNILPDISAIEKLSHFKISVKYDPQNLVGGDIYDIFEVKENYYRIFIADATGHGVQAALITMIIKTEYEKIKQLDYKCDKILSLLNTIFYKNYSQLTVFFSSIVVDIDTAEGMIYYSNAGHPVQYVVKGDRSGILSLSSKGRLVGVLPDIELDMGEIPFEPGDKLVLFTDGLFEQFNEAGIIFGEDKLYEILENNVHLNIDKIVETLYNVVIQYCGKNSIEDDVTVLGIGL